ncbi:preprotein translocase subunit SecE [Candidatus Parcubacteria bacterium]|nr:preprotein translocase subunit SecE [Patescibacteria group bacterium]MBU4309156.1 preprotein translocase subunit SecE [Patescibacteria group bacterium]MBU4432679.1 preprotein translocase subunit SecE [Patescibacteria group bacterium]MBU4577517.1 preprotein translocase subunit SecE [Patescibacteria group bacterium]MCG2697204.1 preprotein translocase subunit SecE [Candidatus Parcubacteria bacterium]
MNAIINYVKGAIVEMKKVTWPTKNEAKNYTILVIVISIAIAAFLGALDYLFTIGFEQFLNK